ncbi:homoserine kinase [Aliikangiella marina]|uniref:Homoserine kinase n=1 Tax=Aliikangiella marina TaxID=1712262 RepID=A0A545T6V8_9GAMM|nr:homoserine kinase [Aliikangiella marina]TQV72963.1 homoserine kinase [Aliikangiella marina]
MSVSVFAPISIGNLSVGFDTLGLAISPIDGKLVGDIVRVEEASHNQFVLTGSHTSKLPDDENNIVWQSLLAFDQALEQSEQATVPIKITLEKNIPVSSGLGSSACSVVASLVALNEFYHRPFSDIQLLKLMGEQESAISGSLHYDNVAPCFLGGLQLMLNKQNQITQKLPVFEDVYWTIAYPDVEVSTKAAREILPDNYSRSTLIEFGQNLAGFIDASYRQDKTQAFNSIVDVVAEPHRTSLIPNFLESKSTLIEMGNLAVGISGSGPTLFAATDDLATAQASALWLNDHYLQSENGFVHICKADLIGARKI